MYLNCRFLSCQVGVTHYFSFLKAREELGYIPMVSPKEGMAATISYWQDKKKRELDGPTIYAWLFAVIGMLLLFAAAYLPDFGPLTLVRAFALLFLGSMTALRALFLLSAAAHIGEAIYAWQLARKVDPANAKGWFWQTFALGFFSLRFLLRRAKKTSDKWFFRELSLYSVMTAFLNQVDASFEQKDGMITGSSSGIAKSCRFSWRSIDGSKVSQCVIFSGFMMGRERERERDEPFQHMFSFRF